MAEEFMRAAEDMGKAIRSALEVAEGDEATAVVLLMFNSPDDWQYTPEQWQRVIRRYRALWAREGVEETWKASASTG